MSVPGVSGTSSGNADTATFSSGSGSVTDAVTNRELGQIIFNNAGSLGNFTIGSSSNTIYFNDSNNSGAPAINETGTATSNLSETIQSNIMAMGANGASANDIRISTSNGFSGTITLSGNISSTATSGVTGIRVITSGVDSLANVNNVVVMSGAISNGGGTNQVAVAHARDGVLVLSGPNTFSGGYSQGLSDDADSITRVGVSSTGLANAPTSGAFGTGVLTWDSGEIPPTAQRRIQSAIRSP